ncbi:MAG: holo-ACP synthase [Clostridiaceae bacterium]|jgi:holo-[acyl-carrier protein] synthase|nr:holo-ACP synthase [Clostridiaceae bacterium]
MGVLAGIDIVEIERIRRAMDKSGDAFIRRVYTPGEIEYCESRGTARVSSYAARFSAKEAVSKALGTGISQGVSFQDIEVVNDANGKPRVILYGEAQKRFRSLNGVSMDISLTHSRKYAAAYAVIQTEKG